MFKKIVRKTLLFFLNDYEKDYFFLGWEKILYYGFSAAILSIFLIFPITMIIWILMELELTKTNLTELITSAIFFFTFLIVFFIKFRKYIKEFIESVSCDLFFKRHTSKGKAISIEDFERMEKENNDLYNDIVGQKCSGFCYFYCFLILKFLKKGNIRFIATKALRSLKIKNKYTMHVIYENNDWAFDTYSANQYPSKDLISTYRAKSFKTFEYSDIENLSYEEFKTQFHDEFLKWCEENDCNQKWFKED